MNVIWEGGESSLNDLEIMIRSMENKKIISKLVL